MQAGADALLAAITSNDPKDFLKLTSSQKGISPGVDVIDALQVLNRSQHEILWQNALNMFKNYSKIAISPENSAKSNRTEKTTAVKVLDAIITLATLQIEQTEPAIVNEFVNLVADTHGCLLSWPGELDKIKYRIMQLGEDWFRLGLPRKTTLALKIIIFLLRCTTSKKPRKVDIKHLWNLQDCVKILDMSNAALTEIRQLMMKASTTTAFLTCEEGNKFIVLLFEYDEKFVEDLHAAIKSKLTVCNLQQAEAYGKIYFKAWKSANATRKQILETKCIQDLMYYAIHINPVSAKLLITNLRRLLSYFHSQKQTQAVVRQMLFRLYEPILWRSLKVANSFVRANATLLFFDTFPLEDTTVNNEELETLLEMQYKLVKNLLEDEYSLVRTYAVYGTCHICNVYWELIPMNTIAAFLKKIAEHAFDSTCANTRMTVFKGLSSLVQNPLSQQMLKKLLPELNTAMYDKSENVRIAFVSLLQKVKGLSTIKYWDIVPRNDLLDRLQRDTDPVCQEIVCLIFSNYYPAEKTDEEILQRNIMLVRENRKASRRFYHHANKCMDIKNTERFILLAVRFTHYYANKNFTNKKSNSFEDTESEMMSSDDNIDFPTTDFEVICGLLDAICILWAGINSQLAKDHNATIRKGLEKQVAKAMRLYGRAFKGTAAFPPILCMASYLPANKVHPISGHCISHLKSMTPESPVNEYAVTLNSLLNWGMADTVLELAAEWVASAFPDASNEKSLRRRSRVKFCEPREPQPMVALQFLKYMFKMPIFRKVISKCQIELLEILKVTKNSMVVLENCYSVTNFKSPASDELVMAMFQCYCQLAVLIHKECEDGFDAIKTMKDVILWAEKVAIPHLASDENKNSRRGKRKKSGNAFDETKSSFEIVKTLLNIIPDMFLCSIANEEFVVRSIDFCDKILEKDCRHLVIEIVKLVNQLMRYSQARKISVDLCNDRLADTIHAMLKSLLRYASVEDRAREVLPKLRPTFCTIFSYFANTQHLAHAVARNVFAITLVEISSHMNELKENLESTANFNHLPILSSTLLYAITRKKSTFGIFVAEGCKFLDSQAIEDATNCNAAGYMFIALKKETRKAGIDTADFVTALEKCINNLEKSSDNLAIQDAKKVVQHLKLQE